MGAAAPQTPRDLRQRSFAQDYRPTAVDRFGVWLSARRMLRTAAFDGRRVADLGCGYHASFARSVVDRVSTLVLLDVALAPDLKAHPRIHAIEGHLPGALDGIPSDSVDVVVCNSVVEHLWEPLETLVAMRRICAPAGVVLLNVPSWRGKWFLELSSFRLGLSPADEMNDHKMYYDPRDLWPLLVRAGYRPQSVRVFRHKFGLNTFAACHKET